ncbi:ferritin-like domain-containing protein [Mycolicibacterium sediminis]|uniref:DUF4439 domain-containing protein n=1 Tax=Mycolicibacterium sediminis TaxID=1286180 RepID=A0A7I7QSM4_9MYCO|nr:ferritin-like domain-containing protein [Mycolicibacterium sediminis]BBY29389.1 hypothetical protein MSEDJ_34850 [Mycolicibacterium sediminis]
MTSPTPGTPTTPVPPTTRTTSSSSTPTTSVSRTPDPARPEDGPDGALYDAVATEHGVIYGYGLVSAHSTPDVNDVVASAMRAHRALREDGIALLEARNVTPPLPAAGYQIPTPVENPTEAATLAVRMEEDSAVAWRAVLEQATSGEDRTLAVTGLTEAAVTAATWRRVLGVPITVAFPGGNE